MGENSNTKTEISTDSTLSIPCYILKNRDISVLEAIVVYLKEEEGLTYHEIAVLLNRDDRTIWTCYNRAMKKRDE